MVTRTESAAATRRALVHAAGELLDTGGPDAVTLREVGARAGVSRSAPYRHFADKESLLAAVATEAWNEVGDALAALRARPAADPERVLRHALMALVEIGRTRPHLYRLMFAGSGADPTLLVRAAERAQDVFVEIVAEVVGPDAARRYGGLLLSNAHGVTDLEISGHLLERKWHATAEGLLDLLVGLLPRKS